MHKLNDMRGYDNDNDNNNNMLMIILMVHIEDYDYVYYIYTHSDPGVEIILTCQKHPYMKRLLNIECNIYIYTNM